MKFDLRKLMSGFKSIGREDNATRNYGDYPELVEENT